MAGDVETEQSPLLPVSTLRLNRFRVGKTMTQTCRKHVSTARTPLLAPIVVEEFRACDVKKPPVHNPLVRILPVHVLHSHPARHTLLDALDSLPDSAATLTVQNNALVCHCVPCTAMVWQRNRKHLIWL